jgi:argininosuccinate lyase
MTLKDETNEIIALLKKLTQTVSDIAKKHTLTIMPGYTHLQRAQPITFAHHLMAYANMFLRDLGRLKDAYDRTNSMPLGSGALAGTTYPIDRQRVCDLLGFAEITQNSLDGVSDRDFCIELCSALSILMMHLSRFSEEVILWCSWEFKFIELDDAYATGSSIMPQKKNPDVTELIRGKTGRVYGDLMSILTTLKGMPLAYNKDIQEDKEPLFDAVETVKLCIEAFVEIVDVMEVNEESMYESAKKGYINATDMADYLVVKGMPFRDAHSVIGRLVLECIDKDKSIEEMSLEELKEISSMFDEDIYEAVSMKTCVERRLTKGAPGHKVMAETVEAYKKYLAG